MVKQKFNFGNLSHKFKSYRLERDFTKKGRLIRFKEKHPKRFFEEEVLADLHYRR